MEALPHLYLYLYGVLRPAWQQHLDTFFLHSFEHSQPWTIEGNLQAVGATNMSATVQVRHTNHGVMIEAFNSRK